jgi:serine/threonine protein kinase
MHRQGLVHRDIKLENIVYESNDRDRVKLIDFGLCTAWEPKDGPMSRFCGTVSYLAPEVQKGSYTSKVDLWCVGAATYTLLTGELLCRNSSWGPIFSKRFGNLSAEAKNFITGLLVVDPKARMSASAALRHRWMQGTDCSKKDRNFATATTASIVSLGRMTALASEEMEAEYSSRFEAEGSQLAPVVESKASLWQSLPSMPGANSTMFSGKKMSVLWASVRKTKATSRVVPEMEEEGTGAGSSDAWHGLVPHDA